MSAYLVRPVSGGKFHRVHCASFVGGQMVTLCGHDCHWFQFVEEGNEVTCKHCQRMSQGCAVVAVLKRLPFAVP